MIVRMDLASNVSLVLKRAKMAKKKTFDMF